MLFGVPLLAKQLVDSINNSVPLIQSYIRDLINSNPFTHTQQPHMLCQLSPPLLSHFPPWLLMLLSTLRLLSDSSVSQHVPYHLHIKNVKDRFSCMSISSVPLGGTHPLGFSMLSCRLAHISLLKKVSSSFLHFFQPPSSSVLMFGGKNKQLQGSLLFLLRQWCGLGKRKANQIFCGLTASF